MGIENVLAIIALIIGLLSWLNITPKVLARLFSKYRQSLVRTGHLALAFLLTSFVLFSSIYIPSVLHIFSFEWAIWAALMMWVLIGVWLPIFQRQRFWNRRLTRFSELAGTIIFVFILIGFWIVRWPDWKTPALLTSFANGTVLFYIANLRQARKKRQETTESQ